MAPFPTYYLTTTGGNSLIFIFNKAIIAVLNSGFDYLSELRFKIPKSMSMLICSVTVC